MKSKEFDVSTITVMNKLLDMYNKEVEDIFIVNSVWDKLNETAKTKYADEFDNAIIARETLLEDISIAKSEGVDVKQIELGLFCADKMLLEQEKEVYELYGLRVIDLLSSMGFQPVKK